MMHGNRESDSDARSISISISILISSRSIDRSSKPCLVSSDRPLPATVEKKQKNESLLRRLTLGFHRCRRWYVSKTQK
jgi:hypothetical protein